MPLDDNLYRLDFTTRPGELGVVDVKDKRGFYVYGGYFENKQIHLTGSCVTYFDPSTEVLLATLTTTEPTDVNRKPDLKVIQFFSPNGAIECKNTSGITWEWSFVFEGHIYYWKREGNMLSSERGFKLYAKSTDKHYKDEWDIALYQPSKRGKSLQILHYEINRLDPPVKDLKGLEIITVISLLSFIDPSMLCLPQALPPPPKAQPKREDREEDNSLDPRTRALLGQGPSPSKEPESPTQAFVALKEPNVVQVYSSSDMNDYLEASLRLLQDTSLLYIIILSQSPRLAALTLKLAEEVKRKWYKKSGEELLTFVTNEDSEAPSTSSKKSNGYVPPPPPSTLKIFVSRVDLGLAPQPKQKSQPPAGPVLRPAINFDALNNRQQLKSTPHNSPTPSGLKLSNGKRALNTLKKTL